MIAGWCGPASAPVATNIPHVTPGVSDLYGGFTRGVAEVLIGQAAAGAPPPISIAQIAAVVLGVGVMAAGARLMVLARRVEPGQPCDPPLPLVGAVRRSTILTLSMCVLVLGYHIAAWAIPHWLALHVPAHRWWMLVGGVVLAAAGSVLAERAERE